MVNINPTPEGLGYRIVGLLPVTGKGKLVLAAGAYNGFPCYKVNPANMTNVWVKQIEEAQKSFLQHIGFLLRSCPLNLAANKREANVPLNR